VVNQVRQVDCKRICGSGGGLCVYECVFICV
jgi:hypothetical protein